MKIVYVLFHELNNFRLKYQQIEFSENISRYMLFLQIFITILAQIRLMDDIWINVYINRIERDDILQINQYRFMYFKQNVMYFIPSFFFFSFFQTHILFRFLFMYIWSYIFLEFSLAVVYIDVWQFQLQYGYSWDTFLHLWMK